MKILNYFFLILLFIGITTVTNAQSWTQIGQDIDGEAEGDESGRSVSLNSDGSTVAVGARFNDGNGNSSGHVRVYQINSGIWTQLGEDIDGEAEGDQSGRSVSLSYDGSILAVGANRNDGIGSNRGHVRIYQFNTGTWSQIGADIDGDADNDNFGQSLCLSSDGLTVAVGAHKNDGTGVDAGHVRIYQNNSGTWSQIGADIDGEAAGDYFGISVSLSSDGSVVAVGATGNDGTGIDAGQVRIYQNNSGTWTQIGADIGGEAAYDECGSSVSLSSDGSTVAVGAIRNDGTGIDAGQVRIFQNNSGIWTQIGADIDGEAAYDECGSSVSLGSDGSTVAVGAIRNDGINGNSGHARIFQNNSGTWTQIGEDIDGEAEDDDFGESVSLSSDHSTVAVGAHQNDGNGSNAGHVRVFQNPFVEIPDVPKTDVLIYPNPTNGIIYLSGISPGGSNLSGYIELTDLTGKTICKGVCNKTLQQNENDILTLDLTGIESGIYILKIKTDKDIYTSKIVKE